MAEPVKPKRPYDSPRRRAQAAATRQDILDTAQRLFERHGYAATTMEAIAAESSVALKTAYVAFETKSGLLRALWNHLLRGSADETPVAAQPWYVEALQEPNPERQLRLVARYSRINKLRIAATFEVIRTAAPTDPDIDALWRRIQTEFHANQRTIIQSLDDKHALAQGLDIDRATDILWTLNHPDLWQLLVTERSWTPEQYEQWCADTACTQLLTVATPEKP
ncbi:MAG: TetR/AcrR family transcriptional regulator [Solirubrobacteraceae bacterium]